ncbi:hypothetical protein [Nocardia alba]|uniref:Uncharacterized protein n=1 Tax=Nocardia alba TaxID=225051 RepID=A0A4R1FPF9_9NOCA|nr:hypothetical protein [Nocardia alba]TCJ95374.1 hypothetical protein DFR71_4289 [Nocardia alba]
MLTPERLLDVSTAAANNFKKPLDLIAIHSEQPVRGTQPRASLNPFTVMSAGGAWERLIADLVGASQSELAKPGHHKSDKGMQYPDTVDGYLRKRQVIRMPVTSRWEAAYAQGWHGAMPTRWITVTSESNDADRQVFLRYVRAAIGARNAAAHFALAQTANAIAGEWKEYGGHPWDSDAASDTLQSGYVRGATALWLQLIDTTLVAVAADHGWDPAPFRLPADWFGAVATSDRYHGVEFWGGRALHRVA